MQKLKYLEKIYFKTIIDLLRVVSKFDFTMSNISIIKNDRTLGKTKSLSYSFEELVQIYNYTIGSSCELGDDYYIDSLMLDSSLFSTDVRFNIFSVTDNLTVQHTSLTKLDNFQKSILNFKFEKLKILFGQYGNVYRYIKNLRGSSIESYYSKCYADLLWSSDKMSNVDYSLFLKYNVFDLGTSISYEDKTLLEKIRGGI